MTSEIKNKATRSFGIVLACLAMAACGGKQAAAPEAASAAAPPAAASAPAAAQESAHALLIVLPEKTPPADLAQKIAGWKSSGAVSNAVLMKQFDHEVKPGYSLAFNELGILDFPSEAAYDEWKNNAGAALGPDVIISRADVLLDRKSKKNDPTKSIFVTGVYESLVSEQDYQDFTDAYIEPNMANQYFSGIMTRYTMYLEREPTGGLEHPKAFLVTEYANQAEYDRKSAVKNAYKTVLLSGTHPEWARINDSKKALRRDYSETYANPVAL